MKKLYKSTKQASKTQQSRAVYSVTFGV